ncbi:MAG: ATP-binding protein [Coriobacteriales bacterium]|jgi:predicted AAA+ superfamily ATPase|nr:ATP-binding protein [Coriobacteriales bacterium]
MKRIRGFIDQPELVKAITGLRRSGKSVFLELIQQEILKHGASQHQLLTYNFEDMNLYELRDAHVLHDHLLSKIKAIKGRAYLFLDEIQEVEGWEACINSLRVNSDVDIYITGSNAKMLTGEYSSLLAGRYIEIRMYPFSFDEFCIAFKEKTPGITDEVLFQRYLNQGGMPFLTNNGFSEADVRLYLRDIYTSTVIKDIIKRNRIRDVDLLERIINYLLANMGKVFSANSIVKYFKNEKRTVALETVLSYIKACVEVYLFNKVKQHDVPGKKQLLINEKYYVADHGLRQAVLGSNQQDIELVLENIVCQELLRRGYLVSIGRIGNKEIDFVCRRRDELLYVQVCYLLASRETVDREFNIYYEIADNYPKYVVSMDRIDFSRDGIRHKNIIDFLLTESF